MIPGGDFYAPWGARGPPDPGGGAILRAPGALGVLISLFNVKGSDGSTLPTNLAIISNLVARGSQTDRLSPQRQRLGCQEMFAQVI